MVPLQTPLPATTNDTLQSALASYRIPTVARHLSTAILRPGAEEGRLPERGGYCPVAAPTLRGGRRQSTGRAAPKATDVRGTGGGGRARKGGEWSRTGASAEETTSTRSGRRTALQTMSRVSSGSRKQAGRRPRRCRGEYSGTRAWQRVLRGSWPPGIRRRRKSQARAIDRATKTKSGKDTAPRKGVGGGQQKRSETAREESKREEMDRVARHVAD